VHLAHIGAGATLAFIALGFLVPAIEETHWAFTTVVPTRICGDGQTGSCVTRKSALVVAANGSRFTPARLKHGVTVSLRGPSARRASTMGQRV
jgi:hypothetical protein